MMKHFSIFGVLPPNPESADRHRRVNKTLEVVAATAQRALQLADERFPGIEIYSLQHRGAIEIIQDSE